MQVITCLGSKEHRGQRRTAAAVPILTTIAEASALPLALASLCPVSMWECGEQLEISVASLAPSEPPWKEGGPELPWEGPSSWPQRVTSGPTQGYNYNPKAFSEPESLW